MNQPDRTLGDSGTGKSHLHIGHGMAACKQGRRVRYATTAQLVNELAEAADERRLSRIVARHGRLDLLCLDDLGYVQLDARGSELLSQILIIETGTDSYRLRATKTRTRRKPSCQHRGVRGMLTGMQLSRLEPGDDEIAAQACLAFGADGDLDPAKFLARPETTLIIAKEDSRVVGWVYGHELLHPHGGPTMLLYALDVAEDHRRRGIGTALVAAFLDHARATGCSEVWVLTNNCNPAGIATYRAAGGQREPVDQVIFTWALAGSRS